MARTPTNRQQPAISTEDISSLISRLLVPSSGEQTSRGTRSSGTGITRGENVLRDLLAGPQDQQPELPQDEPEEIEPGPNEKIVQGIIDKNKKDQAKQALQQNSGEQVLEKAKKMDQQQGMSTLSKLLVSLGAGLTTAGGGDASGILSLAGKRIDAQTAASKERTAGAVKEQERTQKFQDDTFKQLQTPLTSAKDVGLVERTITSLTDVTSLLQISIGPDGKVQIGNKSLLTNKNIFSRDRQALKRARDGFVRSALRLESGAAIGEKEEKDFQKTFGFQIGLTAFARNPEVIARSLLQLQQNFESQRANLNPNSKVRQMNQEMAARGVSPAVRKQILAEGGHLG